MKSRKAQLSRKLEMHQNARKRIENKLARRAESEVKMAIESVKGVYQDTNKGSRLLNIRQDDPTSTMNSYSR